MKKLSVLLTIVLLFAMVAPAMSVPLFPDVPANHWARDAVAELAAKGLLEGYPDGTFKGDRAATRWEMATVVARLLAWAEKEHATFATKDDLNTLRNLVNSLKEELDALGVRVTNLEENLSKLDKRVWDLEKIRLYGSVDAVLVTNGFRNGGVSSATGLPVAVATNGYSDFNAAVGAYGASYNPFKGNFVFNPSVNPTGAATSARALGLLGNGELYPGDVISNDPHKLPVADFMQGGRMLTNGVAGTWNAILGLKIRVSDDVSAGGEFNAYVTTGDPTVAGIWGVTPGYLNNPYTGNVSNGNGQSANNQPFTRMNIDNFWFVHNPSGTKAVLGSIPMTHMDGITLAGQPNPTANGPKYLPLFGADATFSATIWLPVKAEILWSILGGDSGGIGGSGAIYHQQVLATNWDWAFKGGDFKINFARAWDGSAAGSPAGFGGLGEAINNGSVLPFFGGGDFATINPFGWITPYAFTQFGLAVPNTTLEPVMQAAGAGGDGTPGTFGPQSQTSWSATLNYTWEKMRYKPWLTLSYASTNYKPNNNSPFTTNGQAYDAKVGATFANGNFDLDGEWLSVAPNYDPYVAQYSTNTPFAATAAYTSGVALAYANEMFRFPNFSFFPGWYQLHDSDALPNNRTGGRIHAEWRFPSKDGKIGVRYSQLAQSQASVPIGYGNTLSGITGYGLTPGFMDPVFGVLSGTDVNGNGIGGSETVVQPSETPRGRVTNWEAYLNYTFPNSKFWVGVDWQDWRFTRNSNLPNTNNNLANIAQNQVDRHAMVGNIDLAYPLNEKFTLKGGFGWNTYTQQNFIGNMVAVGGNQNNANLQTLSGTTQTTIDTTQTVPYLGFDYNINKYTSWGLVIRAFNTTDRVNATVSGASGFNWNGNQVSSEMKISF